MNDLETIRILGVPLAVTDYARAVELCKGWARERAVPRLVAAANTHVVALSRTDETFRAALEKHALILPDAQPLRWVMNARLASPLADRVYGPTFMLRCLEATQLAEFSHFLVGGTDELLADLTAKLRARFPGLNIAGGYAPPFPPWPADENERMIEKIKASGANFVWIGLGCPKQERWLGAHAEKLPPAVYGAVGAAFAFHAGRVKQAPAWMQRCGLEWLFRLCAEPRRLWRRYFTYNTLFLFYLALDTLRGRESGKQTS